MHEQHRIVNGMIILEYRLLEDDLLPVAVMLDDSMLVHIIRAGGERMPTVIYSNDGRFYALLHLLPGTADNDLIEGLEGIRRMLIEATTKPPRR